MEWIHYFIFLNALFCNTIKHEYYCLYKFNIDRKKNNKVDYFSVPITDDFQSSIRTITIRSNSFTCLTSNKNLTVFSL